MIWRQNIEKVVEESRVSHFLQKANIYENILLTKQNPFDVDNSVLIM